MMAHNDRSSKFESLVSHAQLEFLRSEASNPNIPSDKRFSRIGDFQIDGQYCDITLISSDKVYFKAHKVILASASDYFQALFSCPLRESFQNEVELPSLDGAALRRLLDFVYMGKVDLMASTLPLWLEIGSLYQFPSLLDECAVFMSSRLSFANAAYLFSLAERYSLESVRDALAELVGLDFQSFVKDERQLFLTLPASFWIAFLKNNDLLRKNKSFFSEDLLARAMLQWLDHNNADMALTHELLSLLRFGTMSPLALRQFPEAILRIQNRALSASAEDFVPQQSMKKLAAALYRFSSIFGIHESRSLLKNMSFISEFPGSSPIRHLLTLNPHTFLPRSSKPGVVSISEREPEREDDEPVRPLPPQYYKLKRFEADSSGQCSFAPENYRISHRDPPDFIFRMQLSPDFELLAASFSPALNAFVSLHWHGASENCSHPDVVNFDAQICSPKQWAALDGNSYRTAISVYFPDKMALCFASGRELLAVPRSQGTLVMLHDRVFLICGRSKLCPNVYPDLILEFSIYTSTWSRVSMFMQAAVPETNTSIANRTAYTVGVIRQSLLTKGKSPTASASLEEILVGDEQHTMEQPASDTQDMLVPRPMEDNGDGSANVLSGAPAPTPTVGAQSFSRGDDGAAHEVDKEELCISSRRLLQVVAFIGDGVSAASDELQQVLYISGQMLSFTEPSNNFSDLKNCCYRLRLVTANNLDEQPIKRAKLSEEALWNEQSTETNREIIPLSAKMDLSALPKSDSAFILEQLPSMNLTRQNHQLLHYRSSAGDFELLIALCGSLIRSGSAADAGASHLFPKLEFLDLQRLSLGWVLVETDQDAHFYTKYRLGHKFIVIGDSIIAFGRHMAYDRQCLLVSFDLRYITEELSRQLPIRESMPPIISDKSPMKLLLNGKCCWKLDAEAYQYLAYGSYSDKMFFLSRLPRY